ncbi:hypothetical protein L218DRAFT_1050256 [Marasmius fiardii PR-910]|nr:hypothetical protein L218DRAFT_1050256 [Marasmius fiardii PR-910]
MVIDPSSTVSARINYLVSPPPGIQAYQLVDSESGELKQENISIAEHDVALENIRGKEHLYTLDNAGFQYLRRPTKCTDFSDSKQLEEYVHESAEIVKEVTGASRVVSYGYSTPTVHRLRPFSDDDEYLKRKPVDQVHCDVSPSAAVSRLQRSTPPKERDALLRSRRIQIMNLWRPIANPAHDWPLAFCPWTYVDPKSDTFPTLRFRLEFGRKEGDIEYNEQLGIRYNPSHQWKYVPGMTPEELVIIKNYDTEDGVAGFVPHSAFEDPTTPKGSPPRESIEVRYMVFYD